ncbi:unnamed protein product [Callosobruchus maculatus]
MMFGK